MRFACFALFPALPFALTVRADGRQVLNVSLQRGGRPRTCSADGQHARIAPGAVRVQAAVNPRPSLFFPSLVFRYPISPSRVWLQRVVRLAGVVCAFRLFSPSIAHRFGLLSLARPRRKGLAFLWRRNAFQVREERAALHVVGDASHVGAKSRIVPREGVLWSEVVFFRRSLIDRDQLRTTLGVHNRLKR